MSLISDEKPNEGSLTQHAAILRPKVFPCLKNCTVILYPDKLSLSQDTQAGDEVEKVRSKSTISLTVNCMQR